MADDQQPIVVKRIKKGGGGAHGGAWKIAYADFVTAMMAFFLLMWLLGSTTQGDLKGISEFFQNPLRLSLEGGPGSGSATSPIHGGGQDLTKSVGEMARSNYKEPQKVTKVRVTPEERELEALRAEQERQKLNDLKGQIEAMVEARPDMRQFKNQILMDMTTEGLRLQIVDEQNRPMFDSASSQLKPYSKVILQTLGQVLNQVDNRVSIAGHTDAARYAGGDRGFSNWELSAERANACRRELIAGGMDEVKVVRVLGLAASIPLDTNDPFSAMNRRISIVVMNKKAAEALIKGVQEEVPAESFIESATAASPAKTAPP
jgi:chemotaxis protein MotB